MKSLVAAESGLAGALSRLMVVSEQYPDLKANQNMMQLTEELTSTENKISFARQAYNDSVMIYNTAARDVPDQPHRRHVQLRRGRIVRHRQAGATRRAEGFVLLNLRLPAPPAADRTVRRAASGRRFTNWSI